VRYAGPSELAADIDRHLSHRVVMARPPSLAVRWRKTWRRHRVALTLSAALIALSILGGAQALRAHQTSVRNEAVSDFVVQLLNPRQPVVAGGPSVALLPRPDRDALIRLIRDKLADQPELAAKVQVAAGIDAMNTTGKSESLREARDLTRSQQGADSRAAIEADEKLARVLADSNANAEAEEIMRSALSRRIRLDGPDHLETWRSVVRMAYVLKSAHKHQQAAEQFEAAIAHMKPRLGPDDPDVVSSIVGLSGSYLELGRYRDTQILLEGALASISRVPDERQFQSAVALYNLACANARLGDSEKALEYLRASFATGFDRPGGAFADLHLFSLHGDPRFEELDRAGRLNQPTVWYRHLFHAEDLVEQGRCAEAEPMLRELIAARDRIDEESFRSRTGGARVALIHCWIRRGRYDDAEKELLPMIPGNERHGWPAFDLLAQCELGRGRRESALAYLAKAADAMEPDNERVHVVYLEAQREALAGHDRSALERLTSASDLGFDDFDRLENDLAFQNLRSRPEFRAIAKAARARAL
jgi:tetratricopeptide (TPR) repeat protein